FSSRKGLTILPTPEVTEFPFLSKAPLPDAQSALEVASRIYLGQVYPGMNLTNLAPCLKQCLAVILGLYHSGTGPAFDSDGSLSRFIELSSESVPVLLSAFPDKYLEYPYETTIRLIEKGAKIYRNLQPHQIFVLLTLSISQGKTMTEALDALSPWELAR
ncbi:MAG: hypothetical protein KDE28_25885, partial [Anaerolineales bacterium]|nr:hypothetical protein [Anaerolineales bacterium]